MTLNLDDSPFAPLSLHLTELLDALSGHDIPVVLVGGFGLILRRLQVEASGEPTYFDQIPNVRATEDFDLLLNIDVLADVSKMQKLRGVLDTLGYEEILGREYYQFSKPQTASSTGGRNVKVDLLAPVPPPGDQRFKVKERRIRPLGAVRLHAHLTPEAIASEEEPWPITLGASQAGGPFLQGQVLLPNTYTLYLMKLHAFRDEQEGVKSGDREPYASKHASDLFTLTALLTPRQLDALPGFRARHSRTSAAQEAGSIVQKYFSDPTAAGSLRVLQALRPAARDLNDFLLLLQRTFPSGPSS